MDVQTSKRNSPLLICFLTENIIKLHFFFFNQLFLLLKASHRRFQMLRRRLQHRFAAQLQKRLADFDTSSVFPSERGWENNGRITIFGMKLLFKLHLPRLWKLHSFRHRFQSATHCSVLPPISRTCLCIRCSVVFVFFYYIGPVVMWLVGPGLIAICLF